MVPEKDASGRKIVFDMDGVITGESCYWDAAALVVWELFYAPGYMGLPAPDHLPSFTTNPAAGEVSRIRKVVFEDDAVISLFKNRAVNSNWDLAFLTFTYQLVQLFQAFSSAGIEAKELPLSPGEELGLDHLNPLGFLARSLQGNLWQPDYSRVLAPWTEKARGLKLMEQVDRMMPARYRDVFAGTFSSSSRLWKGMQRIFQEWYFGDEQFASLYGEKPNHPGKEGLMYREQPVLPQKNVRTTLERLLDQGWTLGIATGRPFNELYPPLEQMELWAYFDQNSVATFTDVEQAEKMLQKELENTGQDVSLAKPHPFSFLKAYWAGTYPEKDLAFADFPRPPGNSCLVVGDSMADLLAARQMEAEFIGVLTGHNGPSSQALFQQEGARAVFPDITYLPDFLG